MTFADKTIACADCGAEFVHSGEDQKRYAERGFTNEPKRCADCRAKRKATGFSGGGGGGAREFHTATCAECGKPTEVPFKPTEGRPVYCRDCYQAKRGDSPRGGGRR
jgi:CxxC-x17-CxxC domain-containing protein